MAITAGSLGARVEAYCGTIADEDNLSLWLTDGVRHVSMLIHPEELKPFALPADMDTSAGTDITGVRFLYARRNSHRSRIVPHELYEQFTDPLSLHYATENDPVVWLTDGKVYGYPTTGTWQMVALPISTVLHTYLVIPNFPRSYEHIVVLYAAVQGATAKVKDALADLPNAIEDPSFDWTNLDLTSLAQHFTDLHRYLDTDQDIELAGAKLADINMELDTLKMNAIKTSDLQLAEWEAKLRKYTAEISVGLQKAQTARLVLDSITASYASALNGAFGGKG